MCRSNACGCGQASPLPAAAIIATAGVVVVVSGTAAALTSAAVAILAVLGVAAAAGISVLVWAVRCGPVLYRPHSLPALEATRTPAALPGGQPRAIGAPRRVIPGVPVEDVKSERI